MSSSKALYKAPDFGNTSMPFCEPLWYSSKYYSPYYTESHHKFRATVRKFVETEIAPHVHEWDEAKDYPFELHRKAYEAGIYSAMWPKEFGGTPPEGCDAFHDLILIDELSRCGSGGMLWALFFAFGIALPPLLKHGSQELKDLVARDVLTGKKVMALAVTEPWAGSDVAGLTATARREGDYFIVNGEKKFITAGTKASFFTVAVRTGGTGMGGISLLLVEKDTPGFSVRRMKTQGWWMSGTSYLTFDDCKIPAKNLIGKENEGFKQIMYNFNHERFVFAAMSNRYARDMLEDSIQYARERKTFGKYLIEHQAIRHKIAEMARHVEATHALLETVAYQMKSGVHDADLGSYIAMVKVQATQTMGFCAKEASQVFGGASCVRGGKGERVERLYREVPVNAIAGGSEEVLRDLATKPLLGGIAKPRSLPSKL